MSTFRLIARSLRHFLPANLGIVLALSVSTAVAVAALQVGNSFDQSMRELARERVGSIVTGIRSPKGPVTRGLARRTAKKLGLPVAAVVTRRARLTTPDEKAGTSDALVVGIDYQFAAVSGWHRLAVPQAGEVVLSAVAAARLGVAEGDAVVLQAADDGSAPAGGPLTRPTMRVARTLVRVKSVVAADEGGAFSLQNEQMTRPVAYVSIDTFNHPGTGETEADWLLVGAVDGGEEALLKAVQDSLTPEDLGLRIAKLESGAWQVSSDAIYLPDEILSALTERGIEPLQVLTYLLDTVAVGERSISYALVAGLSGPVETYPELMGVSAGRLLLNEWAAQQLDVKPGEDVVLTYLEERRGKQTKEQVTFRLGGTLPMSGLGADADLMPYVPGVSDAESCRDWEVGVDIDLNRIRPEDEAYWNEYRGAPKAFLPMAAAKRLWGNRRATLTGLRLPAELSELEVHDMLSAGLPESFKAMAAVPFADRAQAAVEGALDMGEMVFGFGGILALSALLLAAMVIGLALRARSHEPGLLSALGWPARAIRRVQLGEVAFLAVLSCVPGLLLGVGLTALLMSFLAANWGSGPAATGLSVHWSVARMAVGAAGGVAISLVTALFVAWRQGRILGARLLARGPLAAQRGGILPVLSGVGGILLAVVALVVARFAQAGTLPAEVALFGAGFALVGGFLLSLWSLLVAQGRERGRRSLSRFGLMARSLTQRPGRVMAATTMLALGIYLVVAASAYRLSAPPAGARSSGTGGFDFVATTSVPLLPGSEGLPGALPTLDKPGLVVPISVHEGDEASCRNLTRPQNPQVFGVPAAQLSKLGAFTITRTWGDLPHDWEALTESPGKDELAGAADMATITWSLQARLGDVVEVADNTGRKTKIRLVAALENSIWQGGILIDSRSFRWTFRDEQGSRMFLVDVPDEQRDEVAGELARTYRDYGWNALSAESYLELFLGVQNRYLGAFQLMGLLALALGALGFGVLVLRNGLERRRELALLEAVGQSRKTIAAWLGAEQLVILVAGVLCGLLPASAVVVPMLVRGTGGEGTLLALVVSGAALLAGALATVVASLRSTRTTLRHVLAKEV